MRRRVCKNVALGGREKETSRAELQGEKKSSTRRLERQPEETFPSCGVFLGTDADPILARALWQRLQHQRHSRTALRPTAAPSCSQPVLRVRGPSSGRFASARLLPRASGRRAAPRPLRHLVCCELAHVEILLAVRAVQLGHVEARVADDRRAVRGEGGAEGGRCGGRRCKPATNSLGAEQARC